MQCPKCQAQMNQKTVQKEGANKGRKFWSCSNYPECNGFAWVKEQAQQPQAQPQDNGSKYSEDDKKAFVRKDQMNARQSAYKGVTLLLASGIEAGIIKSMPHDKDIFNQTKKHAKFIFNGLIEKENIEEVDPDSIPDFENEEY